MKNTLKAHVSLDHNDGLMNVKLRWYNSLHLFHLVLDREHA
jgi:hypothetical protein